MSTKFSITYSGDKGRDQPPICFPWWKIHARSIAHPAWASSPHSKVFVRSLLRIWIHSLGLTIPDESSQYGCTWESLMQLHKHVRARAPPWENESKAFWNGKDSHQDGHPETQQQQRSRVKGKYSFSSGNHQHFHRSLWRATWPRALS